MSNALALAAVTSTVRYLLLRSLDPDLPGPVDDANVTVQHPRTISEASGPPEPLLNVFLYQVSANHSWNLTDLPTRDATGGLSRRPLVALDLHYLISCQGADESLDAQRLLGRAVIALAANPVLTRDVITAAIERYGEAGSPTEFLNTSDLADQVELVKLSPAPMSLEETSKLWSVMLQTPYLLSVAYTATVVLIEIDVPTRSALPVRSRNLTVSAGGAPVLAAIAPDPPNALVTAGSDVVLTGSRLVGDNTRVRIGRAILSPREDATAQRLQVTLDDTVAAGLHRVQILHRSPEGSTPIRTLSASNVLPLMVRPAITVDAVTATQFTLRLQPPLAVRQRVTVTLTTMPGQAGPAQAVTVQLPPATATQDTLAIPRNEIPIGTWLVRVQVDGVDSVPELDGETFGEPSVVLT